MRAPLAAVVLFGLGWGLLCWWLLPRFGHVVGPFAAGISVGMAVWVWDDPPEYIAKWRRGRDGERRTEKALKKLKSEGWLAFHDREGDRGNLDHVLIGPGGVFLLDSKNLAGTINLDDSGLTTSFTDAPRDGFTYTHLGNSMKHAAATLKERLEEQTTTLRLWVQAVVVIWGTFEQQPTEQDKVVYLHGDALTTWLSGRHDRLSPRDRSLIELAMRAELVAPPFRSQEDELSGVPKKQGHRRFKSLDGASSPP